MRVKILLADSAEVREGLLFLLGGGWTQVGPALQPFAIAGTIEVEWEETNTRHRLAFTIEDGDGAPLMVPGPDGERPVRIESTFDVGRPPGAARGQSFIVPIAVTLNALPWQAGRRYVVKAILDDQEEVDRLTFSVRPTLPARG